MNPYKVIDMQSDPRRDHFEYFSSMANPYVGVTVQVDVDAFVRCCKETRRPFFLSFLYCIGQAANAVPQLRRRIMDGQVVEFERCDTSHIVMRDNETYAYCRLNTMQRFDEYIATATVRHEQAKHNDRLVEEGDVLSQLFVSCLPWLHYTALLQPTPMPADSNPRISFGKYASENGRLMLPVSLLVHHALADGLHIARFYAALDEKLKAFTKSTARDDGIVTG